MRRFVLRVVLLFLVLAGAAVAFAATAEGVVRSETVAEKHARAAVTLDGEVLFHVRGTESFPAEERAQGVSQRIHAIAEDGSIPIESLRNVDLSDRTNLLAGEQLIMSVFNADAVIEGVRRQVLAEAQHRRIARAIEIYRYDRSPRVLLIHTGYALGATLAFVLLLFGFRRGFHRLETVVERRFQLRVERLQAKSHDIIQAGQVWKSVHGLLQGINVLVLLLAAYLYTNFVLGLYPWTRPLAGSLLGIFIDPLRTMGLGLLGAVPGLVFVVILAIVTRYLLRLTRLFFIGIEQGTIAVTKFEREWALPTYKIVRLLVIVFALVLAYPHIPGSQSEAFKGLTLLLGVIFSLGSSSFIANLIAGYSVIYRRAFKVGDRIQVNQIIGDVTEIRLMVTHIRTIKNEEITVPNSLIIGSHVVNYSRLAGSQGLILHTVVGIGYETPWRQVEAMLRLAAERTPGLFKNPPPFVLQKTLGDFAVTYELNVYCNDPHRMEPIYSALHKNILDVFNEYDVQIMTPAYRGDPAQPKLVPKDQWYAAPAEPAQTPAAEPRKS